MPLSLIQPGLVPDLGADHLVGVGVDLVDIEAYAAQLALEGTYIRTAFTPGEHADVAERGGHARHWAVRWAAKEAVIKAWSATFHGRAPVLPDTATHLVETVTDAWGRPRIRTHGALREHLQDYDIHVSLSHDGPYAIAYVALSAACRYEPSSRLSSSTASSWL